MPDAYIYDAIRTPRGKGKPDGSLHEVTALRLSAGVLDVLRERSDLPADAIGDVIWGNVAQVGEQELPHRPPGDRRRGRGCGIRLRRRGGGLGGTFGNLGGHGRWAPNPSGAGG